jgi:aromatase
MSAMSRTGSKDVEHHIDIEAPASDVFDLVADVRYWPRIFPPAIHVEQVERSTGSERIRIWATANGEVKSWMSRRMIDPGARRIDFRQEVTSPPTAEMSGTWLIEPISGTSSRVRLLHTYRAVNDDPELLAWIDRAVDSNSQSELAALKAHVDLATERGEQATFSFEDAVVINGAAADAYDFISQAQLWKERLPHVDRVLLREDAPGQQILEMDTRTSDGSAHTTVSVRICFPHHRIVYKQIVLPALMTSHTGRWELTRHAAGSGAVLAVSQHTVSIKEENITQILGPEADLAQARDFVRRVLGSNSLATLEHARKYAESRADP